MRNKAILFLSTSALMALAACGGNNNVYVDGSLCGASGSPCQYASGGSGEVTYDGTPVYSSGASSSGSSGSVASSIASSTKDVDLQQAQAQQQALNTRAQALSDQFQMNFSAAQQLIQLSDRMNALQAQAGGMTTDEAASLQDSALSVVGISHADAAAAYASYINGDKTAIDNLIAQGAANVGVPASSVPALRDQLMPMLGLSAN